MLKAVSIFAPISMSPVSSEKSDNRPLDPILLFCGIGLFAFVVAILTGVQGVWY
jgi:hypothetical protein